MPSSFTPYTSGIQPIQGIAEAGKYAADTQLRGWEGLGQSLAIGIKAYNDNKMKSDVADQKIQMLGGKIQAFHKMFDGIKEYEPIADQLNSLTQGLEDAPNLSLGKRLSLVNEVEAGMAGLGQQVELLNFTNKTRENKQLLEARAGQNPNELVEQAVTETARTFDLREDYASQELNFSNQLDKLIKLGAKIDKQKAIEGFRARIKDGATAFSKTNPLGLKVIEQIENAGKMDKFNAGDVNLDGENPDGVSPDDAMMADWSVTNPVMKKPSALPFDTSKLNQQVKDYQKEIDAIAPTLEKLKKDQELGLTPKTGFGEQTAKSTASGLRRAFGYGLDGAGEDGLAQNSLVEYIRGIKASHNLTAPLEQASIDALVKDYYSVKNTIPRFITDTAGFLQEFTGHGLGLGYIPEGIVDAARGKENLSQLEENRLAEAVAKMRTQKAIDPTNATISGETYTPESRISQLESRTNKLKGNIENAKLLAEAGLSANKKQEEENKKTSAFELGSQKLGVHDVEQAKDEETKKQEILAIMQKRLGYTPANFDTLYGANTPSVSYARLEDGTSVPVMRQPDGNWKQLDVPKSSITPAEYRLQKVSTFGTRDPKTGELIFSRPVEGFDLMLAGNGDFDSVENALKYKEGLGKMALIVEAMEEVKKIALAYPLGTKLPWNTARTKIVSQQAKAINLLKESLGLDRLSDKDVQIIMDRIPQNESLWRTKEQSIQQADDIIKDVHNMLKKNAEAHGLKVRVPSGSGTSINSQVRTSFQKSQRGLE